MGNIIDLSVKVENNCGEPLPIKVKKTGHKEGADKIGRRIIWSKRNSLFNNLSNTIKYISGKRRLNRKCFPDEEFISLEYVTINSHAGTHMDAPSHFGTKCEGKQSRTIDEIPLEWCFSDGVVLDLSHKKGRELITVDDIKSALNNIDYRLKPFDIVLIKTETDKKWGTPAYFTDAPGMSAEATEYLIDQGIKVMGIDCYGFDRPFMTMINDFFETKENKHLWPAHIMGRKKEYIHIERMCNLYKIPQPYGFKVACFPIKLASLDAAWVRAVAIL